MQAVLYHCSLYLLNLSLFRLCSFTQTLHKHTNALKIDDLEFPSSTALIL